MRRWEPTARENGTHSTRHTRQWVGVGEAGNVCRRSMKSRRRRRRRGPCTLYTVHVCVYSTSFNRLHSRCEFIEQRAASTRQTFLCCCFFSSVFTLHFRTHITSAARANTMDISPVRLRFRGLRTTTPHTNLPITQHTSYMVLRRRRRHRRKKERNGEMKKWNKLFAMLGSSVALIRRGVTHAKPNALAASAAAATTAHHLYKTNELKPFCVTLVLNLNARRRW